MPPAEQRKITSGSLIYNKCTISHFKCPGTLFSYFQPSRSFSAWVKRALDKRVTFVPLRCRFISPLPSWPLCFCLSVQQPMKTGGARKAKEVISFTWRKKRRSQVHMVRAVHVPLWMCAPEPRCCFNSAGGAAEWVCWQMGFFQQDADSVGAEPLLPSTRGSALVSAAPHKRFCPLSITARQRWSLLSLICIGISSISIPGTTEEQTCMDGGVKGELGPRHISFNQT